MIRTKTKGARVNLPMPSEDAIRASAMPMFRLLIRAASGVHPKGETARDIKALIVEMATKDEAARQAAIDSVSRQLDEGAAKSEAQP